MVSYLTPLHSCGATRVILNLTNGQPGVDDPEMKQLVDDKVEAFWKSIEGGYNKRGQIIVTFSEKRPRKTWFIMGEEEIPWEQWIINAEIRQPTPEKGMSPSFLRLYMP
ncbi:hypothetical protein EVJ58_g8340 [Rhodofomes roseus]|uniref:Autophagy-related protein 101 n=1 Tax=Rhodofomes roseus TaxID=34475 RepID=A0A4Y9XZR3_9APHY|nr:hypothetical protein EVJ58_g8340 [Rhodofomes roseus]